MDPLSVLQQYATGRRSRRDFTNENGSFVIFDDVAYAKDAKTSLFQYGRTDVFYTLESILYLWDNRDLKHPIYVRNASGAGIMAVTMADRRDMLEYLKSRDRTELPANHDPLAPVSAPIPLSAFADLEGPERKKQKLDPSQAPRIDHLLNDGPQHQSSQQEPEEIRDLNDQLTADKIAALRMKRKNNQRRNITQTLDDGDLASEDTAIHVERGGPRDRERTWRTRENCLGAATKSFASVLTILQGIKTREEAQARAKAAPPSSAARSATEAARAAAAARSRTAGYSRYDQEQFTTGEAAEFGVDDVAQATFVGTSLSMTRGAAKPAAKPSTPAVTSSRPMATPSRRSHAATPDSNKPAKRQSRTPIIIIPAGTSASLITMYNVKDILQDMRFVTTDEKKAAGARRENECLIQRRRGDTTVPYRVVDNPMKLSPDEWDRVVAVFAMGPAWQFKGWQWNDPVDIFSHIAAFHVTYDDMKIDPNIAKWSVTGIQLSRTRRHLDKARIAQFWEILDKHIVKNKSFLRY